MHTTLWTTIPLASLAVCLATGAVAATPEMQVLERKDLPGGLVREKLRLPGFDPDEAVPAIALHPAAGGRLTRLLGAASRLLDPIHAPC